MPANVSSGAQPACKLKICDLGQRGTVLPFAFENTWPKAPRAPLYLFLLLYFFLGVAIIADVFMAAIERVTSKKRRQYNVLTKKYVTVTVWNATIANLTLMALGSSAPEILLSVIELFTKNMRSGDLGPSTIVGSAAFNLLVISAVCIISIPDGEVRKIQDLPVYCVTGFFSIWAYVWLLVILLGPSVNTVDIWEGALTFLFFPILCVMAFAADKGWFSPSDGRPPPGEGLGRHSVASPDMATEELSEMALRVRQQHGELLSDEQVVRLINSEFGPKPTRAAYRSGAIRNLVGGRKVMPAGGQPNGVVAAVTSDTVTAKDAGVVVVGFASARFAVLENVGVAKLALVRQGDTKREISVRCKTRDGTAKLGTDYQPIQEAVHFAVGETEKCINVKIIDDAAYEDDEEFYVELVDVACEKGGYAIFSELTQATVVIIDDDEPGVLRFEKESIEIEEGLEDSQVSIVVNRINGCTGKIGCSYSTEDGSAIAGADYFFLSGNLEMEHGQMSAELKLTVKARGRFENEEDFRLNLSKPYGGTRFDTTTDGGADSNVCTIIIKPNSKAAEQVQKVMTSMRVNWDKVKLGHSNWKSQFAAALYPGGEEDDEEVSLVEKVMHYITMPWKLIFAVVPPVDYCDGWATFVSALMMIGGVTALIGDLAGLLGCCMGLDDGITAITFVALGTSLPDTFASKAAAVGDPTADASLGNITGSNSVNVFLGLGLPWLIGSIYWRIKGPDAEWIADYPEQAALWAPNAAFVVKADSLGTSVSVFSICACICMALLTLRRKTCGGELGGPTTTKYLSAAFLVFLWFIYVGVSTYDILSKKVCP